MAPGTLIKADGEVADILYGGGIPEQRNQALVLQERRQRLRKNYERRLKRAEKIRLQRSHGLSPVTFERMLERDKEGKKAMRNYGLKASQVQRWYEQRRYWYAQFPQHSPVSLAYLRCLEELYPPGSKIIFTQESFQYAKETAVLKGFKLSAVNHDQVSIRLEWDYWSSYDEVAIDERYLIEIPDEHLYPLPVPPEGLGLEQEDEIG